MMTQTNTLGLRRKLAVGMGALLLVALIAQGTPAQAAELARAPGLPGDLCQRLPGSVAAAVCVLDQQQWATDGGAQAFGGATRLTQTFKPALPGPVCQVQVYIRRNTSVGAAALKLSVVDLNNVVQDSAAILVVPPVGNSIQTFAFGCDGRALVAGQVYKLRLESPGSLLGAYAWFDNGNAYPRGEGINAGRDYTFRIYMCR